MGMQNTRSAWPILLLLLVGVLLSSAALLRRPDLLVTFDALFGDQGMNYLVADDLLAGKLLYRDVFSQYGPLPAYLYAGFASAFGNTPTSYLIYHQLLSLAALRLLTSFVGRWVRPSTTCFVVLAGLVPTFLTPGALLGAYTNAAYNPLERLCLIVLALTWTPPAGRRLGTAAALGLILGVWQGVKFGGACYAGLALVLTDVLALALTRPVALRSWLVSLAITGTTFLAVETCWVALAFALLPWRVAADVLWPQYMLEQYASLGSSPWPVRAGWRYFFGQQLTPLVSVLLGAAALIGCARAVVRQRAAVADETAPESLGLFLPFLFFLLGFAGYFRHEHLPLQYVWAGCLPGALFVDRLPLRYWLILGLCWLPGFGLVVKTDLLSEKAADCQAVRTPTGDLLYLTAEQASLLDGLVSALARIRSEAGPDAEQRSCVLLFPDGAGMHHFFGIPRAGRHAWYLAGFIRPHDEAALLAALDSEYAIALVSSVPIKGPTNDPGALFNALYKRPVFSDLLCGAFRARLHDPVRVGPRCLVFRVR